MSRPAACDEKKADEICETALLEPNIRDNENGTTAARFIEL